MKVMGLLASLLFLAGMLLAGLVAFSLLTPNIEEDPTEAVTLGGIAVAPLPRLDPAHIQRGAKIYAEHCASCHGDDLRGAANWRYRQPDGTYPPPPHDASGHTWQHPDQTLINMIQNGINPSLPKGMPAFKGKLTPGDVGDVIDFIKSHWDLAERKSQWWQTQRNQEQPPQ